MKKVSQFESLLRVAVGGSIPLMDLFIRHPELCFVIAAFFVAFASVSFFYKRIRSLPMFVPGFFWLAYGAWEYSLKGSGANIRIDLLLIYPLLLLAMTAGAGMTVFFTMKNARAASEDPAEEEKGQEES